MAEEVCSEKIRRVKSEETEAFRYPHTYALKNKRAYMDILTLLGSPRKRGSTHAVLSQFELLAAQKHTVNRITVVEHDIHGCRDGCEALPKDL
jgi:hypothetical protein